MHYEALKRSYEAAGHEVRVLSGSPTAEVSRPLPGVVYLPLMSSKSVRWLHRDMPNVMSYMPPRPLSVIRLARELRADYDVYHLFGYGFPLVDLAARILAQRGRRFGITVMGAPYSPSEMGGVVRASFAAYEALLGRGTLRRAYRIQAISHFAADNASFARHHAKIDVIHNGTWPRTLAPVAPATVPREPYILSVGRVQWSKGFQNAVAAIASLKDRVPDIRYVIIGPDSGYRQALERLTKAEDVADRVLFTGAVSDGEKEWYIEHARVTLIPSLYEPFGLVSLEFMIRGKIVVAARTGGLAEIIADGTTGHLFEPGDPNALASALERAWNHSSGDSARMTDAAKYCAAGQLWPVVAAKYLAWYESSGLLVVPARRRPAINIGDKLRPFAAGALRSQRGKPDGCSYGCLDNSVCGCRYGVVGKEPSDFERYAAEKPFFCSSATIPRICQVAMEHAGGVFLDIGAGDGTKLRAALDRGLLRGFRKIVAVDISSERVGRLRSLLPEVEAHVGDVAPLVLEDNSVDFVFSDQVIEHVPDDRAMIAEIHRVLKTGGVAFVGSVLKMSGAWYFHRNGGQWRLDETHVREYESVIAYRTLFEGAGFSVVSEHSTFVEYPAGELLMRLLLRIKLVPAERAASIYEKSKFFRILKPLHVRVPRYRLIYVLLRKADPV